MSDSPRLSPTTARARWLLAAVLSLVLLSQWVALVHGVVHPGRIGLPLLAQSSEAPPPSGAGAPGLHDLFSDHDAGSSLCRLLDQLAQPGAVSAVTALAAADSFDPPPVDPPPATPQTGTVLRYLARAPPARA